MSLEQVAEHVANGVFFDGGVQYETSPENHNDDWGVLTIYYEPSKRPIIIEKLGPPEIKPIVDQAVERASEVAPSDSIWQERIKRTKQIYLFELGAFASEDAWGAIATLQALICQMGAGIVVASEGIYDERLKLVLPFN